MSKENDFEKKEENQETATKDTKKKLPENWKLWGLVLLLTGAWRIPLIAGNYNKLLLFVIGGLLITSVGLLVVLKILSMKYGKEKELRTIYSNNSYFSRYLKKVNEIVEKLTGYSFM